MLSARLRADDRCLHGFTGWTGGNGGNTGVFHACVLVDQPREYEDTH